MSVWLRDSEVHSFSDEFLFLGQKRTGERLLSPGQGIDVNRVYFLGLAVLNIFQDSYLAVVKEINFVVSAISNGDQSLALHLGGTAGAGR